MFYLFTYGHAELCKQNLVVIGSCDYRDVHTGNPFDLVVVDLGK